MTELRAIQTRFSYATATAIMLGATSVYANPKSCSDIHIAGIEENSMSIIAEYSRRKSPSTVPWIILEACDPINNLSLERFNITITAGFGGFFNRYHVCTNATVSVDKFYGIIDFSLGEEQDMYANDCLVNILSDEFIHFNNLEAIHPDL